MRVWKRLPTETLCDYCGLTIYRDQPVLVLTLPLVKRAFVYCMECKGPAPPDLPYNDTPPPQMHTKRMKAMKPSMQDVRSWLPKGDE